MAKTTPLRVLTGGALAKARAKARYVEQRKANFHQASAALDDVLYDRAKQHATLTGTTVAGLIRDGLAGLLDAVNARETAAVKEAWERHTRHLLCAVEQSGPIAAPYRTTAPDSVIEDAYRASSWAVADAIQAAGTNGGDLAGVFCALREGVRAVRNRHPLTAPDDDAEIVREILAATGRLAL
jgi:hypothetical protein